MTSRSRSTTSRAAGSVPARGVAVVLALLLTGCAGVSGAPGPDARPDVVPHARPDTGPDTGTSGRRPVDRPDVPVRPAQDSPAPAPPAPERVEVPALRIDVPVLAAGVDDQGRMALPESADEAAWYRFGPAPGSPGGATVIAAHVDDEDSVGPFARLSGAEPGIPVHVRTEDGTTHHYTVTSVRSTLKPDVSWSGLFGRTGDARLVLVTCGGEWDPVARSYSDNIVVTAAPQR
ncbi:class F sortase [Isoptericola sp. BMS4]|uniref:class F sortase n=1 Tax=Isoptericola sp. BMS4 TaxID=2527875 RepID=UPI0014243F22|nr:class F sortase [Isoptericola sp. BMS4]